MDSLLGFAAGLELSRDRNGQEGYIMYHGTTLQNALNILHYGFKPSTDGMLGPGVYVTRSFQKAAAYPKSLLPGEEQAILRLRVRVGKVKRIDYQHHPLQKTWYQEGYDTAWVPPNCGMVPSGLEENCVWDPSRIEVLDVLNSDGTIKNSSSFGLMPGPFGYPCSPCVPSMLGYSCPPFVPPMLDYSCTLPVPPMLGYPYPPPGFPSPAFGVPYPYPCPTTPPFWAP